jgi:hypothetical protein
MLKNMNYKQRIWVSAILLLMILSCVVFGLIVNDTMQYNSINDDIFGSKMDLAIAIIFATPYFVSLIVLLYCGYVCFNSTPLIKRRVLCNTAVVVSTLTILIYWILIVLSKTTDTFIL